METCAVNIILKNFIIKDLQNGNRLGWISSFIISAGLSFFFMLPDCHENCSANYKVSCLGEHSINMV